MLLAIFYGSQPKWNAVSEAYVDFGNFLCFIPFGLMKNRDKKCKKTTSIGKKLHNNRLTIIFAQHIIKNINVSIASLRLRGSFAVVLYFVKGGR